MKVIKFSYHLILFFILSLQIFAYTPKPVIHNEYKKTIEMVKAGGARLTHEVFEEIADIALIVPLFCEEIQRLASLFLKAPLPKGQALQTYSQLVDTFHFLIDKIFSTRSVQSYTEVKTIEYDWMDKLNLHYAELPLPFGANTFEAKEIFKSAYKNGARKLQSLNLQQPKLHTHNGNFFNKYGSQIISYCSETDVVLEEFVYILINHELNN